MEKTNYRLGRRGGAYRSLDDLERPELRQQVDRALERIEAERPGQIEDILSELMESFI